MPLPTLPTLLRALAAPVLALLLGALPAFDGALAQTTAPAAVPPAAPAAPASSPNDRGRAVMADLMKIVTPDGVQETMTVVLGGLPQWIDVRGKDRANPLLLFVHGGPASPMSPTAWQFERPLQEYFTVVQWDQRGAGRTYAEGDPAVVGPTLTVDRYVADIVELAEHLTRRYGKRKVILAAHSWGTLIALKAAQARPDLFHAYVGIGQVIDGRENERISFAYGLASARRAGNAEAVKEMEAIAPYPGDGAITRERIIVARKWPQFYGGLTAYRSESSYYFRGGRLSPDYTDAQLGDIDQGSLLTLDRVIKDLVEARLQVIDELKLPVFIFAGRHDYTTASEPVLKWMSTLKAPAKRVVFFEHSAHMVPWEEPGKFLITLVEAVRPLAKD
jgi:pimeloyl-ACP methyl ester carboxylesterase